MGKHHPEEDDAPRTADLFGTVDHERPYGEATQFTIIDFGEVLPVRLKGCPECGDPDITCSAKRCYRCGATFTAVYDLAPHS